MRGAPGCPFRLLAIAVRASTGCSAADGRRHRLVIAVAAVVVGICGAVGRIGGIRVGSLLARHGGIVLLCLLKSAAAAGAARARRRRQPWRSCAPLPMCWCVVTAAASSRCAGAAGVGIGGNGRSPCIARRDAFAVKEWLAADGDPAAAGRQDARAGSAATHRAALPDSRTASSSRRS